MRTFVAIELDDECRDRLSAAVERLRPEAAGVRWVRRESMHLTLKFIGGLSESDVAAAAEALDAVGARCGPFEMDVEGVSGFPGRGVPRVLHVGVRETGGALVALQSCVEQALADALGLPKERRSYVPHITLGRVRDRRRCPAMDVMSAALADQAFGRVSVREFVLMRSDLRPDGAVYTVLHRSALGGGQI
jgi:2'-5' RNA ligase